MSNSSNHWHTVNFTFRRLPADHEYKVIQQVDSPVHPLIAYEICCPVIKRYEKDMPLWRFHRMLHPTIQVLSFWFKFYGPQSLCPQVTEYVQQDGLYKSMKEAGLFDLKGNQDIVCERGRW